MNAPISARNLTSLTELLWHIIQIASPLPNRLYNPLRRSLLDLRRQRLQHRLQAALPRLIRVYNLPNDNSLQTHPRPEPRHLPRTIPARWLSRPRHPFPLQMDSLGNGLGLFNLARISRYSPTIVSAAKDRRGGDHNDALSVCFGELPRPLYSELDLSIFRGGSLGAD
jgi:hypothetical protein